MPGVIVLLRGFAGRSIGCEGALRAGSVGPKIATTGISERREVHRPGIAADEQARAARERDHSEIEQETLRAAPRLRFHRSGERFLSGAVVDERT